MRIEVGSRLYFCPSVERMPHGTNIPAGMVEVMEVVDHGDNPDDQRPRFTYVVRHTSTGDRQGADANELHMPGGVSGGSVGECPNDWHDSAPSRSRDRQSAPSVRTYGSRVARTGAVYAYTEQPVRGRCRASKELFVGEVRKIKGGWQNDACCTVYPTQSDAAVALVRIICG